MRINVYGEELTTRTELVKKTVDQRLFMGIRLYLKSHPDLHHSIEDNDESAITLWVPWTKDRGNDITLVVQLLDQMRATLLTAKHNAALSNGI